MALRSVPPPGDAMTLLEQLHDIVAGPLEDVQRLALGQLRAAPDDNALAEVCDCIDAAKIALLVAVNILSKAPSS